MKLLNCFVYALVLMSVSFGQDTGGVAQTEPTGTVIKGKAPVAKELLQVRFPKPKSFTLKNGLTVYVLEDHRMPAVRLTLQLRAGSIFETKTGVAGMTASMLTEGTKDRTNLQIAEQTEGIGANLNAGASLANASIGASGLSETTDTLIALLADVLLNPSFPADRLDRVKFAQRSALSQRRTSPGAMLGDLSSRTFYGGTPYARVSPTATDLTAITREDLVAFHDAYYRPNGAILGVTGDVDVRTLKTKLETALASWQAGPKSAELPTCELLPKAATKVFLIDRPGSAQTMLQFGSVAVQQTDPDYLALVVANRVLGGGSAGRLFQNIRERKGYTYGAYSSLSAGRWPGIWGASASVRTDVTEPAVAEFFNEFNRLQNEPVPADELARAKRSILGGFALTLESPEGILGRTLELVQNGLPLDYWDTYPKRIEAITPADVQRVAKKYLGGGRVQLLAVGQRSKIEAGLAKAGPVEIVTSESLAAR